MQTKWIVITGAPCSGKTTVINEMARLGFPVVHETARAIIESELAIGHTLQQIKLNGLAFQRDVLDAKIRIETRLPINEPVFLDRAIPDSIAYYRLNGFDIEEPAMRTRLFQYKKVFLFDRLRFEKDAVRIEDDAVAETLDHLLESGYRELGYDVIRVPLVPVDERVRIVQSHLLP